MKIKINDIRRIEFIDNGEVVNYDRLFYEQKDNKWKVVVSGTCYDVNFGENDMVELNFITNPT